MALQYLDIINAALTRIGVPAIASYSDGSLASTVASANYAQLAAAELAGYRWRFAEKSQQLQELQAPPDLPWTDAYQLPNDLDLLRALTAQSPRPTNSTSTFPTTGGIGVHAYEMRGETVVCNFRCKWSAGPWYPNWVALPGEAGFYGSETIFSGGSSGSLTALQTGMLVTATYTWAVPEANWPDYFAEAMRVRLEALFMRGIGERYKEADDRDKTADLKFLVARRLDSQTTPGKMPFARPILAARRG
jgi:hypothetical protein